MTILERWTGYDEQSWAERFATLDAKFQQVCEQLLNAVVSRPSPNTIAPGAELGSEEVPCPECDDSGWRELTSGGIWTGEAITSRREPCDCPCGQDVVRELDGKPAPVSPTQQVESEQADGAIRIAIWNACKQQGWPDEAVYSLIKRAIAEPTMQRALAAIGTDRERVRGEALPSAETVARWIDDIAPACIDPSHQIVAARKGAMQRLAERFNAALATPGGTDG